MRDFKSTIVSIICGMIIGSTGAHANSIETKLDGLIADGRSSCEGSFTLLDGAVERRADKQICCTTVQKIHSTFCGRWVTIDMRYLSSRNVAGLWEPSE